MGYHYTLQRAGEKNGTPFFELNGTRRRIIEPTPMSSLVEQLRELVQTGDVEGTLIYNVSTDEQKEFGRLYFGK